MTASRWSNENFRFAITTLAFEISMIIMYAFGSTYDPVDVNPLDITGANNAQTTVTQYYGFYQDVHVMIFVGFGFLMTFLKRNMYNSMGFNLLLAALAVQWSILVKSFLEHSYKGELTEKVSLNIVSLINADFCAASILITYGAVLGKVSPFQMVIVVFFETIFWGILDVIAFYIFRVVDMGGSIVIHTFGAYFGLGLTSIVSKRPQASGHPNNTASYYGDMFATIGTIFLWMYWPSFNGALAQGAQQHRVVINTLLSICASCVISYVLSALLRPHHKLSMVDIQNATLAGGVAVGSSADLVIEPWGAFLLGSISGTISVLGFVYLQPFLERKLKIIDTCGVHNLHGLPGVFGGIAGAISSGIAPDTLYGQTVGLVFPARLPVEQGGLGRSARGQMGYQFAIIFVSIGLGIAGGIFTGIIARFATTFGDDRNQYFSDDEFWEIPEGIPNSSLADHSNIKPSTSEIQMKKVED